MSDFRLTWDVTAGAADLSVTANDLTREDGLETAVLLSLFTDRQVEAEDLPVGETDTHGWWADALPVVEGDRIGSRLWLLARAKAGEDTVARAEEYAREALAWLLEDKVAARVEVTASVPRAWMLGLEVAIYRPGAADPARYRFAAVWSAQEG